MAADRKCADMTEPLKPTRVIVDRTVLAEILDWASVGALHEGDPIQYDFLRMHTEIESGERVELYAADWPTSE